MRNTNVRKIVVTAMLSAVAAILMFIDFSVPFMPSFIKLDISETPALIGSFAMGPAWGAAVCLVKNLINLTRTSTGGVGELCNFLLGAAFVVPAGFIYKYNKSRKGALIASLAGALCMAVLSLPINYFITYPMYTNFMPLETIVGMYQAIFPAVDGLLSCLVIFNMPFTFIKGILCAAVTFVIYKRISGVIKGK
ncbi:MAG: ECF transporter S component [Clostridia bacterium]|nr:ECF transporter S component [Clostridia bacterium]